MFICVSDLINQEKKDEKHQQSERKYITHNMQGVL